MKLTFTLSALHVQVALLDDNNLGFVIGIGKMVKFEDSPSAQLMQLGFDGTWLDDAANDGSAEEILQERSSLVEETDGETCSLWLSGNCHPLHSVFKSSDFFHHDHAWKRHGLVREDGRAREPQGVESALCSGVQGSLW